MTEKEIFMAGWKIGYSDGGEHDCRMFEPTAERAWEHWQRIEKKHDWQFYMNGTFCRRCNAQIGTDQPCQH